MRGQSGRCSRSQPARPGRGWPRFRRARGRPLLRRLWQRGRDLSFGLLRGAGGERIDSIDRAVACTAPLPRLCNVSRMSCKRKREEAQPPTDAIVCSIRLFDSVRSASPRVQARARDHHAEETRAGAPVSGGEACQSTCAQRLRFARAATGPRAQCTTSSVIATSQAKGRPAGRRVRDPVPPFRREDGEARLVQVARRAHAVSSWRERRQMVVVARRARANQRAPAPSRQGDRRARDVCTCRGDGTLARNVIAGSRPRRLANVSRMSCLRKREAHSADRCVGQSPSAC